MGDPMMEAMPWKRIERPKEEAIRLGPSKSAKMGVRKDTKTAVDNMQKENKKKSK